MDMSSSSRRSTRGSATSQTEPAIQSSDCIPPPPYSNRYGTVDQHALGTNAEIADDGRINININQPGNKLSNLLRPWVEESSKTQPKPTVPSLLAKEGAIRSIPRLNIVIHVVGSRGDVQPFIALGRALKEVGHVVRLATHPTFRAVVEDNGLNFFSIGGDPAKLMAFMVKNPGLTPGMASLRNGDVRQRRREISEIISGCWRSCFEDGDGTGPPVSDVELPDRCPNPARPFIADLIIANPPSFSHVHCAEKLGIPLHIMFTMPWTPTQALPHPLANIEFSNIEARASNMLSYALVDILTWQGLGDIINRFREKTLGLEPLSVMWAPGMVSRLRIPHTYCWSSALLPKPKDWGQNIDIAGYFFLPADPDYKPPDDLAAFLASGPPPIYIGFGSIVVDDPNAMTKLIFEAIKKTGHRAVVSKGWGGIGAEEIGIPDNVLMLDNCPHDWLFERVSCVVHHGGAGTTAIGIACGKPTVIVPFFGDQFFWGSTVAKAEVGPAPVPYNQLTADKLAEMIHFALEPSVRVRAQALGAKIHAENGVQAGVDSFHRQLQVDTVRCMLSPRAAVWRIRRTNIRLSAFAATTLSNEGILDLDDLKLYRAREYGVELGPSDPVTGGAGALLGTIGEFAMGVADIPAEIFGGNKAPRVASKGSTDAGPSSGKRSPPTDSLVASPATSTSLETPGAGEGSEQGHKADDAAPDDSTDSTSRSHKEKAKDVSTITTGSAIAMTEATARLILAGMKAPMGFTMNVARGFHNAPKLYNDRTVREVGKVTGFKSGLTAAVKELGFGFYDGISGLVTQPLQGRTKGPSGVVKGFGKGLGGLILKPGAGIFALTGYTLNGVYKEVRKLFGTSVDSYIIACRSKQGYDEWRRSTEQEQSEVLERWYSLGLELKSKAAHSPFAKEWENATRAFMDSKRPAKRVLPRQEPSESTDSGTVEPDMPSMFEEGLRKAAHLLADLTRVYRNERGRPPHRDHKSPTYASGSRSSNGQVDQVDDDEIYEQALRESVAEFRSAENSGDSEHAYDRALRAAMEVTRKAKRHSAAHVSCASSSRSPIRYADTQGRRFLKNDHIAVSGECSENGRDKPDREGARDVTQYAIWRSLTDRGIGFRQ